MYNNDSEISKLASDVHKGHRKRMLERFINFGFDGFADHEILEVLLFYAIPRKNTNPLAHELIERFNSLNGVFDAAVSDLLDAGLTMNAAVLIKSIPALANIYAAQNVENHVIDTTAKVKQYFYCKYIGVRTEQLRVICLDSSMNVMCCEIVAQGECDKVILQPRRIVETALKYKSSNIFIAHNHPFAKAVASSEDIANTRNLISILKSLDINLLDHIIVGCDKTLSMKENGYFSVFDV